MWASVKVFSGGSFDPRNTCRSGHSMSAPLGTDFWQSGLLRSSGRRPNGEWVERRMEAMMKITANPPSHRPDWQTRHRPHNDQSRRPSLWICWLELSKGAAAKASLFDEEAHRSSIFPSTFVCNMEIHSGSFFAILQRIFTTRHLTIVLWDRLGKNVQMKVDEAWLRKGNQEELSLLLLGSGVRLTTILFVLLLLLPTPFSRCQVQDMLTRRFQRTFQGWNILGLE